MIPERGNTKQAAEWIAEGDEMTQVYYMDGYHGGIRGHMPLGCWRDILDQLNLHPEWRLSIDVEPISWDYLKSRDPRSYAEFVALTRDASDQARVEIVAGSYAQPYGWITDGESNIRHLTMGLAAIRRHFPWIKVDTYAVQEPCWTSALPQILRQLGYRRASLKDASTAWGGYAEGFPAETVDWMGPDGTSIPTVPRYACEELVKVYETEACGASEEYAEKCVREGIPHPTGMYYQDLGWPARPGMSGEDGITPPRVSYSIWREYFDRVAASTRPVWQPGQEIFRGALPWGDQTLVRMARQVRRCEIETLDTERFCAVSAMLGGKDDSERMEEVWGHLLMTQHHDGWICAGAGTGENNWAWKTSAQVYAAEFLMDKLRREAFEALAPAQPNGENVKETMLVFNPLAHEEERIARIPMTAPIGTRGFEVTDGAKKLPVQAICQRRHRDGSWNAGELLVRVPFSGLGVKSLCVVPIPEEESPSKPIRAEITENTAVLENDCVKVVFDLKRGGVISSFTVKDRDAELVPSGADFNEYRGYFIREDRFCSNAEHLAKAEIAYSGPLETVMILRGRIGAACFEQRLTMEAGSPWLDVCVRFDFGEGCLIGEPYRMKGDDGLDPHRTYHDGRYRLNAYFPTVFPQQHIDKDCAYDVCRSKLGDTHFKTWNEIKHNILVHWADVSDDEQGLCVFCDHTTAYIHGGGSPFGLALAWGYDAGFWWGRRTLKGSHELRYRIMPHMGGWWDAGLWHECERFLHQPIAARSALSDALSLTSVVQIHTPGIELGSLVRQDGHTYLRVFNAGTEKICRFTLDAHLFSEVVETAPDGSPVGGEVPLYRGGGTLTVELDLPPFAIRTYRIE